MIDPLPAGWSIGTVQDLAGTDGVATDGDWVETKDQDPDGDVRLIQLADIGDGRFLDRSSRYMTMEAARRLQCTFLAQGDLLLARMPDPLGRACIFPGLACRAVTAVDVFVWRAGRGAADASWLMHVINSPDVRSSLDMLAGGTTRQRVSGGNVKRFELPVPPLAEQRRIVARVEALFARTRRARADLERIAPLVERYTSAVVAEATCGTGIECRREPLAITVKEQLRRIRNLRSKTPKLARRKRLATIPEVSIPSDWQWISPDELADDIDHSLGIGPFGSNLTVSDYRSHGVPLVFVRDIRRGSFADEPKKFVSPDHAASLRPHQIRGGEVLITKMGDPPGDTAVYPEGARLAVITADCMKLKPHSKLATADFLALAIRSPYFAEQIGQATRGVAQQKVSLDRFRTLALAVPPLGEQERIVSHINREGVSTTIVARESASALALLDRLEQSILARAFRGELVPQDPADSLPNIAPILESIRPVSAGRRRRAAA